MCVTFLIVTQNNWCRVLQIVTLQYTKNIKV